jgi:hypothetical protein
MPRPALVKPSLVGSGFPRSRPEGSRLRYKRIESPPVGDDGWSPSTSPAEDQPSRRTPETGRMYTTVRDWTVRCTCQSASSRVARGGPGPPTGDSRVETRSGETAPVPDLTLYVMRRAWVPSRGPTVTNIGDGTDRRLP